MMSLLSVMDAMNDTQQQQQLQHEHQQQQQHTTGTAAPSVQAPAADPAGSSSSSSSSSAGGSEQQPRRQPLNLHKVCWLKGLPIPTAANTIAVLGASKLYVYPAAVLGRSSNSTAATAATSTAISDGRTTGSPTPALIAPSSFAEPVCV